MDELDIDRIFPQSLSKRKTALKLITNGMTVAEWLAKVARAGLEKVDVSFITQCYAKDELHRHERKLIEPRPPISRI
jgi:molybdenum cofactor biosynthesis enzyme MoaA